MIAFERSTEVPRSLLDSVADDRYRNPDVVKQLIKDSGNKCYVCEVSPVEDPEVEHRLPHKGGQHPERKYDWENLFYACRHCNSVKNKPKYEEGIIDCCKRDPERLLHQALVEDRVHVGLLVSDDFEVQRTADLIEDVFMSENPALRKMAAAARLSKLQLRMNALYGVLRKLKKGESDAVNERTAAAMLKREAAFAGFTRCHVRDHIEDYPELAAYLE